MVIATESPLLPIISCFIGCEFSWTSMYSIEFFRNICICITSITPVLLPGIWACSLNGCYRFVFFNKNGHLPDCPLKSGQLLSLYFSVSCCQKCLLFSLLSFSFLLFKVQTRYFNLLFFIKYYKYKVFWIIYKISLILHEINSFSFGKSSQHSMVLCS